MHELLRLAWQMGYVALKGAQTLDIENVGHTERNSDLGHQESNRDLALPRMNEDVITWEAQNMTHPRVTRD